MERLCVKLLGLIISVVLARLIAPKEFGYLALLTVFIDLSQTVIQGGLNTALVQKEAPDEKDYSTVFYLSTFLAVIFIILLNVFAPAISRGYGNDALVSPLRVYSISLLFGAFNSVQVAKLQKEMKFKAIMYTSLAATVSSGICGIIMAYMGLGIWALVMYNSLYIVFSCIAMLYAAKWIPKLVFSFKSAKSLFSFGWKMLASSIFCCIYLNSRTLIIGKKFSTDDLSYYNRGQQFPVIITHTLDSAIQSVMFSAMSSYQSDLKRVKEMLKRSMTLGTLLIAPLMVGLAITSDAVVRLLLTEKWLPSVIYLQIICLAEIPVSLISSNLVALKSIGRSDIYMKLEFARRVVMIGVLIVSIVCFDSVFAIVIGYLVSTWLDYVMTCMPMKKVLNYSLWAQLKDVWKIIFAAACMGLIVNTIKYLPVNLIACFILQVVTGIIVYILLCAVLKIESFIYAKDKLMKLFTH